jgi:MHS family proline/betaine transporter-like MFS transporter
MIGNGLEWYDFALYGYYAPILGRLFFPTQDSYVQMISTYGIFAAGFIMRPIGAVLFGYLGDKFGRKFALTLSILLMAVPTACIGLLPTYASIGILAPILLTLVRLLQGLSLAGQFSGSITFIVEHCPSGKRGLAGSTTVLSLCAGMLLGSAAATLLANILPQADNESWGWRIPFLLGIVIAFVGYYIRHHTDESPHYTKAKDEGRLSQTPVREAFSDHLIELLRGIGIYMSVTVPFYILTVFMNGFMSRVLKHPIKDALLMSTLTMTLLMVLVPVSGWLSDKWGRKRMMVGAAIVYFITAYPIFLLMTQPGFTPALAGQILFTIIIAFFVGPAPAVLVELLPTSVRYSGMALSYNICAALFGGTAPMVGFWLIDKTHINTIVAFYIMFCAVVSFISFIGYHDRYKEELH